MIVFKKIVTSLSIALMVVGCGVAILFSWSGTGWKAMSVPTGSMRPAIPPGSLVLVHRVPARSIKVGDVITYISPINPQKMISHRVVKTYTIAGKIPAFVTKGDANPSADQPITEGSVVGRVSLHVPRAGGWLIWGKHPVGLLALVYIPAIMMIIEEVQRMSEYLKSVQPYRLPGFISWNKPRAVSKRLVIGSSLSMVLVIIGLFVWQPAFALLNSNTVTLANNRLSVAAAQPPASHCSSNNNINVSNSSNQTATTGSSTVSGNTSGGTASSGNASNSNSTSTNVTVTNCH